MKVKPISYYPIYGGYFRCAARLSPANQEMYARRQKLHPDSAADYEAMKDSEGYYTCGNVGRVEIDGEPMCKKHAQIAVFDFALKKGEIV